MSLKHSDGNPGGVGFSLLAKLLAISAIAEFGTGIALFLRPAFVVTNLLNPVTSPPIIPIARVAGIALIALGVACWTGWNRVEIGALRALLVYDFMVAAYLAFLIARHLDGIPLWPAVALHATIGGLLLFLWKRETSRPGP